MSKDNPVPPLPDLSDFLPGKTKQVLEKGNLMGFELGEVSILLGICVVTNRRYWQAFPTELLNKLATDESLIEKLDPQSQAWLLESISPDGMTIQAITQDEKIIM